MRLNRLIAQCSSLSRRSADQAILDGRIQVNGELCKEPAVQVQAGRDYVRLDGKVLKSPQHYTYILFNKPAQTLVTKSDPKERNTIWDYLGEKWKQKLNSAGRLDYDTEGLLLLSDDGMFLQQISHPKYELWKVYHAKVRGVPPKAVLEKLANGVKLEDGTTLPAKVSIDRKLENYTWVEISIREGKNRQVRRMLEAVGYPAIKLKRIAIGPLKIGILRTGKMRFLRIHELEKLKASLG